MTRNLAFRAATAVLFTGTVALATLSVTVGAQVAIKRSPSGFNLFSVQQDVELGEQSALEIEKQVPLLSDARVNRFLTNVIARLSAQAPGTRYPYRIKAINAAEINAFALPGGPMYVNRGLVAAARSEAELAGVLAHEMSHVILRHGTEQASKAYLGQAGLSLLGGLLGKRGSSTSEMVSAIGGFGLNAVFMKFSRSDEYEADALGAELMSKAGYDPVAMATMFAMLRAEQGRDPGKLEQFFSSHPSSADRESRIRSLAITLGNGGSQQVVGGFPTIRARLGNLAAAPKAQPQWNTATGTVEPPSSGTVTTNIPAPSTTFASFAHPTGFFTIDHPVNWRSYASGNAVSFAPDGGVVELADGQPNMIHGMIINHYAPFEGEVDRWNRSLQRNYAPFEDRTRPRGFLEDATDDLIRQILAANPYLGAPTGSARSVLIDGAQSYAVPLSGRSPVTGEDERVTVYTRGLPDRHVVYAVCIAPNRQSSVVEATCGRMLQSLRIDDAAAHRTSGAAIRPPS